jgi:hypothetical protein
LFGGAHDERASIHPVAIDAVTRESPVANGISILALVGESMKRTYERVYPEDFLSRQGGSFR